MHFILQIPCRSVPAASIDGLNCGQFGANSSEICGFLAQPSSRIRDLRWTPRATPSPPGCATQLSGLALRFSLSRARAGPCRRSNGGYSSTARPPGGLAAAVNSVRNDISASGAQLCVGDADLRRMTCRRSGHSRDHVLGAFTTRIDHAGLAARGTCAIAACALGDDAAVRCCNNVRTAEKQSPARQPGSFVCAAARNYFAEATLPNWASNGL